MNTLQMYAPLVGRVLIALPLLDFARFKLTNWGMMIEWMAFKGFPTPGVFLGLAIATEFIGGVLLIAGFKTRWAAATVFLYLIPVTFIMHNFWAVEGPERQGALESFEKGFIIMGGLLFVFALGAGRFSVDDKSGIVETGTA